MKPAVWPTAPVLLLAGILIPGTPADELPLGLRLVRHERFHVEVRLLSPDPAPGTPDVHTFDVEEASPGQVDVAVVWPGDLAPAGVRLRAEQVPAERGAAHRLRFEALLASVDGPPSRAERELTFDDEATALFEVARRGDRPLTLALTVEVVAEETLSKQAPVGPPVELGLEIQWSEQGHATSLETNQLHTFVGQAVSYSFQLGDPGAERSVQLSLLPTLVLGDVLRIEIDITAKLPAADGKTALTSRHEKWFATAGATSTLALETGDPPRGFRFLVTPRF